MYTLVHIHAVRFVSTDVVMVDGCADDVVHSLTHFDTLPRRDSSNLEYYELHVSCQGIHATVRFFDSRPHIHVSLEARIQARILLRS